MAERKQRRIAATQFIESAAHPPWRHSDSSMHYRRFQDWQHREEFVSLYNAKMGKIVWGNGTRHERDSDGVVHSAPAS